MVEEGQKVTLNVYDSSQGLARQLSTTFLGRAIEGIWHTGIVVFGSEYYFGGGIQHSPVGTTPYGKPIKVVDLGVTHVPKEIFEEYLQEMSPRYIAETYNLLRHNCNNFSNEVAQFLPYGCYDITHDTKTRDNIEIGCCSPSPSDQQPSHSVSTPATSTREIANGTGNLLGSDGKASTAEMPEKKKTNSGGDPLGDARLKVQEEITTEFAAIMASGTIRASEAAALATRRVMERHGLENNASMSQR
ncbi:hypothetical protein MKW98_029249 [Papaver atlanticum]|uniref:PPPDE domain-containing protein n=1 Tax=Papaver atlanticum TaxID=357466 RepID=A0AAD4XI14_9MAGN|nr:hypothetical protein MKW98_029249 [Papaver atlanticum]